MRNKQLQYTYEPIPQEVIRQSDNEYISQLVECKMRNIFLEKSFEKFKIDHISGSID